MAGKDYFPHYIIKQFVCQHSHMDASPAKKLCPQAKEKKKDPSEEAPHLCCLFETERREFFVEKKLKHCK